MGNNDLAVRFTENNYSTKSEVSKELKISVIDGVWDKIQSYRSNFYHYLLVKGVGKNQLRVCLCPTVSNKVTTTENKLTRLLGEYNKLDRVNKDAQYFEQSCLVRNLQNLAVKNNLISDEEVIRQAVQGNSNNKYFNNYLSALHYVKTRYVNAIDVDYLSYLYSKVTGNDELTYFYRDFDDDFNASVISRVYNSAPHQLIDQMMTGLFNFIEKSTLSPLTVALISFYYVQFVKPFKDYNEEIAILIAKSILAHTSVGEFAIYLPLEALLNESSVELAKRFHEVQVTSDVTYILTYLYDCVDHHFDKLLDSMVENSTKIIKNDFFKLDGDHIELFPEEPTPIEEEKEVAPAVEVKKPVEAPVIKEVVVEKKPSPAPVVKEEKIENKPQGLAVNYIPEELDEKTALRLERHLLELDLRLKKGQAYFYARHCTLGMYYTIEQYRKAVKCVYETARTSMDKLVEYGYYTKKEFGKKYVYTPVDRK